VLEAGERRGRGPGGERNRVAYLDVCDGLDGGGEKAHLARAQLVYLARLRRERAERVDLVLLAGGHKPHALARLHAAVYDAHEDHHAAVAVEPRVEYERLERRVGVARGPRHLAHYRLKHVLYAQPHLRRDHQRVVCLKPYGLLYLFAHAVGLGTGEVYLVDDGDEVEVVV
jgi:hypothetical protein